MRPIYADETVLLEWLVVSVTPNEKLNGEVVELRGRIKGQGGGRSLLLSGHIDTVPRGTAHWTRQPFGGEVEGNRLYGRRGFLQYQCVVPQATGAAPVTALLEKLSGAGAASFLAVIKDFGPGSEAYLSFPVAGTTLSLDLPYHGRATEDLVHELNAIVLEAGGRVYLAKDAVTRAEDFARMMPRLASFTAVRDHWDPHRRFRSAQSVRLLGDPA